MTLKLPIYLDNHSTTPLDPRVLEEMLPYLTSEFGNAASRSHVFGWHAEAAVTKAREEIAAAIGASPREIVFTSGSTESDDLALFGVARMYQEKGRHVITSQIEHKAILDSGKQLEREGFEVTFLPPDRFGRTTAEAVEAALRPDTILVSIMAANNEIGTVNPVGEIGRLCRDRKVLFHTDAVQAFGKVPLNVDEMGIDLMSLTAHKVYGPKGIGCLYVRSKPRVRLAPLIFGGGHERGMRSGTLNVPGIVGFGAAARIAHAEMASESRRIRALRDRLHQGITSQLDEVHLNGHPEERLPGNLNLSFAYVEGEALMMGIKEVAVSSGSACTSASLEPSYVLRALGVGDDLAHSSIRFGLGRFTTSEEIDFTIERVVAAVSKLREMSPLYEMAKEGIDLKTVQWAAD